MFHQLRRSIGESEFDFKNFINPSSMDSSARIKRRNLQRFQAENEKDPDEIE